MIIDVAHHQFPYSDTYIYIYDHMIMSDRYIVDTIGIIVQEKCQI
jgi:hypothetical protein